MAVALLALPARCRKLCRELRSGLRDVRRNRGRDGRAVDGPPDALRAAAERGRVHALGNPFEPLPSERRRPGPVQAVRLRFGP